MENALGIVDFLRAGYPLFWVRTFEPNRAIRLMTQKIAEYTRKDGKKWLPTVWDCSKAENPIKPIEALESAADLSVVFAVNYHWFLDKSQTIQKILNDLEPWKASGKAFVIVSPKYAIPTELSKEFLTMDFELPSSSEAQEVVKYVCGDKMPQPAVLEMALNAAKGLTATEIENVCAKSLVQTGSIDPQIIAAHKNQMVEREGLLEVVTPAKTFADIRGYENMKKFTKITALNPDSLGLLVIGPPGCGKTLFMECLAGETQIPALSMDFGKFYSKYQGETEQHVDAAISIIKAYGRVMVMVDEFEKQFAGAASSGEGDSGVSRRATSKWLRFMSSRPKGIYIIGTCNTFIGIPPEYLRPGRWDASPFFIDLPTEDEREDILAYHLARNNLKMKPSEAPNMDQWTGAEIAACCHIASLMKLPMNKASEFVIPQAKTMEDEIKALRTWAKGRTIPATDINMNGIKKMVRRLDHLDGTLH